MSQEQNTQLPTVDLRGVDLTRNPFSGIYETTSLISSTKKAGLKLWVGCPGREDVEVSFICLDEGRSEEVAMGSIPVNYFTNDVVLLASQAFVLDIEESYFFEQILFQIYKSWEVCLTEQGIRSTLKIEDGEYIISLEAYLPRNTKVMRC